MKLALMDFQQQAVEELLARLKQAKYGVKNNIPQAVILSSPTGSGKTVIATALMEAILEGSDLFEQEPGAIFLWLSDQPELNKQSRKKIADTCSCFRSHELVVVDTDFDRETFEGGKVYFLNIQKLGKDKLLTSNSKKGDLRQYTIWETIKNTVKKQRDKFYLIIDEAHRGTQVTKRDSDNQQTIIQKFVLGSEDEIPAIDLILGVSATPQRFQNLLKEKSRRTRHEYEVDPEDVIASGLLKDRIILFYPDTKDPSDMTLLAAAAKRWKALRDEWNRYTSEQGIQAIYPALVVQVEDSGNNQITKTDLLQVLKTLEQELGPISDDDLAHSFQEDQPITIGHHKIRKIDASQIQEETGVRIIFFKMALTTGWDCPRAEVMMSFRRAVDHTLIAQLIGRMIRTPLARRIEGRDTLNTVSLFLPHFDKEGVDKVVNRLKTDSDSVPPIIIDTEPPFVFRRKESAEEAINALNGLPLYHVEKIRKASNTRRLMRLSRLLTMLHEIDLEAWEDSRKLVIDTLNEEKERLRKEDTEFDQKVAVCTEIQVNAVTIEQGSWRELGTSPTMVKRDDHNIDDLFNRTGLRLGEGLHEAYWKANYDADDPARPKLELFFIVENQPAWDNLEKVCGQRIKYLQDKYKSNINNLPSSKREEYNKIRDIAKDPESLSMVPPVEIMTAVDMKDGSGFKKYDKHLYIDEQGEYWAKLNAWEEAVIQAEITKDEVVGWLRNYDRKQWAVAMPYEMGSSVKPMYPDFLVVRQDGDGYLVDILEPHSSSLADSYAKARGLANYARKHHGSFGRIELIRVNGSKINRIDLNDDDTRKKVLTVDTNAGLDLIFDVVNG